MILKIIDTIVYTGLFVSLSMLCICLTRHIRATAEFFENLHCRLHLLEDKIESFEKLLTKPEEKKE